jgi:predicted AlkP superfamily phosphohydrolase/phosphomutase
MAPHRNAKVGIMRKGIWLAATVLVGLVAFSLSTLRWPGGTWHGNKKLIILGIDGMDPQLLRQYMQAGKMPHFVLLAQQGSFRELTTSIPPQSPVAWSNLATGMNAGGHGIFDFIHRDPKTMEPYLSTSRVEPARHALHVGDWLIPWGGGSAENLRRGKAFWEYLDGAGVPATVFRIPANFPPIPTHALTFAGMGTPDLRGGYGTFSFYTDDPLAMVGQVEGGQIIPVEVHDSRVQASLLGPDNTLRKGSPIVQVPFTVDVDSVAAAARLKVQDSEFVLKEGEWSGWIHVEFTIIPGLQRIEGICRFYLKQAHPRFQLYVSPINIDPASPALPLSTPSSWSEDLADEAGEFYTQGIAEDTKALSSGVLNDGEYLQQAQEVYTEQRRIFEKEFPKFRRGVFFYYLSSIDLNSHMFWRSFDPKHPEYDPAVAAQYGQTLPDFYHKMDEILGEIMDKLDNNTTLLVLSDHGFAPYYRSFNLNTWLLQNGYIALKPGSNQEEGQYFANVDWSKTRAYGLGLNGLYINVKGREKYGVVKPAEVDGLVAELSRKLLAIRDPASGKQVITRADAASSIYQGPYAHTGPDVIVGYARGYRAGWQTILGAFPENVLEDNTNPWSGDHCIDYTQVPGILLSNRSIAAQNPALTDIAPTVLSEFGIPKPHDMIGSSIFVAQQASIQSPKETRAR